MTQPGTPGGQIPVTDLDGLARRLRDMERDIAELRANTLGVNGIVIGNRGSLRTADFDGTDFAHPGTKGVYLASEAGVGRLVVNDIYLRGGIIGNDALANPLDAEVTSGSAGATIAYTTTSDTIVFTGTPIIVPAGFTDAIVVATGIVTAFNTSASYDFLYSRCFIGGVGGPRGVQGATAGATISVPSQHARKLTGLSGGTSLSIQMAGWTQGNVWTGTAGSDAAVTGFAVFSR